jgi:hypothetical protein
MSEGYGQDTWCMGSLSPGRVATGATVVAQALYRRLITPRGMLRGGDEEQDYGFDVAQFIGHVDNDTAAAALPAMVRAECLKDDRVSRVDVVADVARSSNGLTEITLTLDVLLSDGRTSFSLTLSATDAGLVLAGSLP